MGAYEDLEDRIEQLEAALYRIRQWAQAYPLGTFPEVDSAYLLNAHKVLTEHGMTLDRIAADNMRHVLEGVIEITTTALKHRSEEDE